MKEKLRKLEKMLKRWTHRELSPQELLKTEEGFEKERIFLDSKKDVEYSTKDGEPQLRITKRKRKITPDLSHHHIMHTGFYNDKTTQYRYDEEGRLVEKEIQTGNIYDGERMRFFVVRYDPPGSWIGKKVEETDRHYTTVS